MREERERQERMMKRERREREERERGLSVTNLDEDWFRSKEGAGARRHIDTLLVLLTGHKVHDLTRTTAHCIHAHTTPPPPQTHTHTYTQIEVETCLDRGLARDLEEYTLVKGGPGVTPVIEHIIVR